jgi:DNA repair protein RadD
MMAIAIDETLDQESEARVMLLQHTDELFKQNFETVCSVVAPRGTTVSKVQARLDDTDGQIIFGSTPTFRREKRREKIPFITHLFVDEAHRLGTATAKKLIAKLRSVNPNLKIVGFTATPNRGDGQTLVYALGDGVTFQITYFELIDLGVLVPPRTLTIDLGLNAEIEALPKIAGDYDMDTVGLLLNRAVHNDAVFEHWSKEAAGRQTIGFCATVDHAKDLAKLFRAHGIVAEAVWGDMRKADRNEILERFIAGTVQVVFNCMVLVEGFDAPLTSCIIILRPMLEELTFNQSIGRGLRTLDSEIYPDEVKTDCILLDFTGAAARHGKLEVRIHEEREAALRSNNPPMPETETETSDNVIDIRPERKKLRHFAMREINLLTSVNQPFVFTNIVCRNAVAHNNYAWAGVFFHEGEWHALAQRHRKDVVHLGTGERLDVVSIVDRFLRAESSGRMPEDIREMHATPEQKIEMQRWLIDPGAALTFYDATCRISLAKAAHQIRAALQQRRASGFRRAA